MSENTNDLTGPSATSAEASATIRSAARSAGTTSVIGPTLVVRGEVTAEEDLLVRGRVEGTIDHNQKLTVHQEGTVQAVVRAKEIHVEGAVEGDLFGTERVTVCETGKVVGNVVAPRVAVMEGAHLKGMVDMDSDTAAIERRFQEHTQKSSPKSGQDHGRQNEKSSSKQNNRRGGMKAAAGASSSDDVEKATEAHPKGDESTTGDNKGNDASAS